MSDEGQPHRRRRRRATRGQGAPAPSAELPAPGPATPPTPAAAEVDDPAAPDAAAGKPVRRRRSGRDTSAERGLRDIVGAGHSQVGVSGALRARDVNRPGAADLAEAERDVVITRRNWKPPAGP